MCLKFNGPGSRKEAVLSRCQAPKIPQCVIHRTTVFTKFLDSGLHYGHIVLSDADGGDRHRIIEVAYGISLLILKTNEDCASVTSIAIQVRSRMAVLTTLNPKPFHVQAISPRVLN